MEDIGRILVVNWLTQYCQRPLHFGVSLAAKYGAELSVIHVVDTSWLRGWSLPMLSLDKELGKDMEKIKTKLENCIFTEKTEGVKIKTIVKEGDPAEEVLKVIEAEKIDLVIMRAHAEGYFEQVLVGSSNDRIIRKMPCSIFLVKQK